LTSVVLIKTPQGLRGATPVDQEEWAKFNRRQETMQPGKWMRVKWSTPRNGKHHRKFMALVQLVTENSEIYGTVPKALIAIKLAAGYFDAVPDPRTGEIVPVPHSISFDAMEQGDFEAFYSAALDGILAVILPTMDRATADRLLDMIIEGWA
jgi:hypothetical protein